MFTRSLRSIAACIVSQAATVKSGINHHRVQSPREFACREVQTVKSWTGPPWGCQSTMSSPVLQPLRHAKGTDRHMASCVGLQLGTTSFGCRLRLMKGLDQLQDSALLPQFMHEHRCPKRIIPFDCRSQATPEKAAQPPRCLSIPCCGVVLLHASKSCNGCSVRGTADYGATAVEVILSAEAPPIGSFSSASDFPSPGICHPSAYFSFAALALRRGVDQPPRVLQG